MVQMVVNSDFESYLCKQQTLIGLVFYAKLIKGFEMAATSGSAYRQILKELEKGSYKPIYYLMGDESFFIDSISDYIRKNALPEEARDFNQIVLYGNETTMNEVIQRARAYPMAVSTPMMTALLWLLLHQILIL